MDTAAVEYAEALEIASRHPEHRAFRLGLIRRYEDVLKALHRNLEVAALNVEAQILSSTSGGTRGKSF
jgi:hypothetical protein